MDRMTWTRAALSTALGAVLLLPAAGAAERSAPAAQDQAVGVDLSKWQGAVDFAQIKAAGKTYVFVKVSQGSDGVDPDYQRNIDAARAAGLYVGSYHFYTTDHTAQSQFDNVVKHLDIKAGDLPLVVDIEVLSKNSLPDLAAELKTFLDLIEQKYSIKPIIYSGENFANEYLKGFADYPLWLAEYTDAPAPKLPLDWSAWTFWQYSQSGSVPGVNGAVDLDRFNGTAEQIEALLIRASPVAGESGL
jgi:lysozyme